MAEAHIRIDDGIKRGPRQKPGQAGLRGSKRKGGSGRAILPRSGPELDKTLAEAIDLYSQGYTLTELAEDRGVSKQAMRSWLLKEVGNQYHDIQTQGLLTRIAEADDSIQDAKDNRDLIVLACAREQARFARMDLERRRPHLYGPKQEITHTVQPVLNITVVANSPQIAPQQGQVIDVSPMPQLQPVKE